ncbi:sugar phosphate isomerase/epimerase [Reyranella sp. CPCC 100927]|uniref:sugar phosphate isomerase/epimerase family protein n=1 Tax=Reyranella sp. CPCC 100927 TaxID=2599616 RepID=UPI0015B621B7|nr:TIM barrel protein [Reyranella sp. CPCC 100927]
MIMPRLLLSVIGDEIGPTLDEMLSFCAENGVSRLEMRTVEGRNLLGMTLDEVAAIAARIHKARITVPTFVSPVLKWPAPGRTSTGKADFAFDPANCPAPDPFQHAFDIALMLGATRLRIFSWLAYDGFTPADLAEPLAALCALADTYGVDLQMENEPVCNVATIADLGAVLGTFAHRRLRPLVDICNVYTRGAPPAPSDLRAVAPRTDHLHLKDYSIATGKVVPIGQGDVDFAGLLPILLGDTKSREVLASIETHVPADPRNATRRNVHAVRHLAEHIGAEIK